MTIESKLLIVSILVALIEVLNLRILIAIKVVIVIVNASRFILILFLLIAVELFLVSTVLLIIVLVSWIYLDLHIWPSSSYGLLSVSHIRAHFDVINSVAKELTEVEQAIHALLFNSWFFNQHSWILCEWRLFNLKRIRVLREKINGRGQEWRGNICRWEMVFENV
jgi:hypothetical protein